MDLSNEEKSNILSQRLKQFAAEKFNHEVNKEILTAQQAIADEVSTEQLVAEIVKTDEAIFVIDNAIATTQTLLDELA